MIQEMIDVRILPERADAFERAVAETRYVFKETAGCRGMDLYRSLERTGWYRFIVGWDDVDDHVVRFRNSNAFAKWQNVVGGFYAEVANGDHLVRVSSG